MPVRFTSRVLKENEYNYHEAEREALALLRILDSCETILTGKRLRVI